ncbi:hypothetical protein FA13DRAFT_1780830 [Coprinellus micaceus]|uniref:Uncharacterized protein n=1 Tax=Coprinellus micaceus TaxID=71717 RepID=A0A4Y7SCE8_COPMI|nr:hypothetical protein FA13DRAFT_1780830 [Coprinellus micaceus]
MTSPTGGVANGLGNEVGGVGGRDAPCMCGGLKRLRRGGGVLSSATFWHLSPVVRLQMVWIAMHYTVVHSVHQPLEVARVFPIADADIVIICFYTPVIECEDDHPAMVEGKPVGSSAPAHSEHNRRRSPCMGLGRMPTLDSEGSQVTGDSSPANNGKNNRHMWRIQHLDSLYLPQPSKGSPRRKQGGVPELQNVIEEESTTTSLVKSASGKQIQLVPNLPSRSVHMPGHPASRPRKKRKRSSNTRKRNTATPPRRDADPVSAEEPINEVVKLEEPKLKRAVDGTRAGGGLERPSDGDRLKLATDHFYPLLRPCDVHFPGRINHEADRLVKGVSNSSHTKFPHEAAARKSWAEACA